MKSIISRVMADGAMSAPPTPFSRHVARHSEGNPFFVGEVLRHVAESDVGLDAIHIHDVADADDQPPHPTRIVTVYGVDHPGIVHAVAAELADMGVHRYNHNLETARSHFPQVVTTHTWEERWDTLQLVREHGMEVCCGGIIGMGESLEQRTELAVQLAALDPHEVPLNFLNR